MSDDTVRHYDTAGEYDAGSMAILKPAPTEDVLRILGAPEHDDGRSEFQWCRFANGDLALIVFPKGETYEEFQEVV